MFADIRSILADWVAPSIFSLPNTINEKSSSRRVHSLHISLDHAIYLPSSLLSLFNIKFEEPELVCNYFLTIDHVISLPSIVSKLRLPFLKRGRIESLIKACVSISIFATNAQCAVIVTYIESSSQVLEKREQQPRFVFNR